MKRIFSRKSPWQTAISDAQKQTIRLNPKDILGKDFSLLQANIKNLLKTNHPLLNTLSNYYFENNGKNFRPVLVLLIAKATSSKNIIFPHQKSLAEITEIIHTASLLHDDVIDDSIQRRSIDTINYKYGNKMAILAGDYLLARASLGLSKLDNLQVVQLLSMVIADLVEGEFMQLKHTTENFNKQSLPSNFKEIAIPGFEYYLQKTFLKTASLIEKSCQASAILGNCPQDVCFATRDYGRNLGIAFQVGFIKATKLFIRHTTYIF